MGHDAFNALYGTNADKSNAFGKCVAKKATQRAKSQSNAVSACRAEQADTTFAADHGGKTFNQFYGTGKVGKDALGKCVSSKAKAASGTADANVLDAVKQCKADRAATRPRSKTSTARTATRPTPSASASRRPRRRTRRTTPRSRNEVREARQWGAERRPTRFSMGALGERLQRRGLPWFAPGSHGCRSSRVSRP